MLQFSSVLHTDDKGRMTGLIKHIYCQFQLWSRNQKTRRQLKQLPSRLLEDIGVTQGQADTEAAKPFWE